MLRAIRDCHFGADCTVNDLLLTGGGKDCPAGFIVTDDNRPDLLIYPPMLSSNLPLDNIHKNIDSTSHPVVNNNLPVPAPPPPPPQVNGEETLPLSSIATTLDLDAILRQNKLILFGGVEGFLEKMKNDRVEPNVKSLTYLIQLTPNSIAAEDTIIKYAKSNKIPLDVDFFNILIKKRALRGAKKEAKVKKILFLISLSDNYLSIYTLLTWIARITCRMFSTKSTEPIYDQTLSRMVYWLSRVQRPTSPEI